MCCLPISRIFENGTGFKDGLKSKAVPACIADAQRILLLRNPQWDISFPIFTRKEVETKRIGKEIKTIISRLNDLSYFLSNIEQNRN